MDPEYPDNSPEINSGRKRKVEKGTEAPSMFEVIPIEITKEALSTGRGVLRWIRNMRDMEFKDKTMEGISESSDLFDFLVNKDKRVSHLVKTETLRKEVERSKRSLKFIDETAPDGALYDYIPTELKKEIEEQLESMSNLETIQKVLEDEISTNCGDLWSEYKAVRTQTADTNYKTAEILLLGPEPEEQEGVDHTLDKDNRKDLQKVRKQIDQLQTIGDLMALEKASIAIQALTASPKDYPTKKMEAEQILGAEFGMIEAQVRHMEDMMEKDLANCNQELGPMGNQTQGMDLISEDMRRRIVPFKEGDEPTLTQEQLDILNKTYEQEILAADPNESRETKMNRKVNFALAACEVIAIGKENLLANALKQIREIPAMDPEEQKLGEGVRSGINLKKGLGTILKTWPQAMVAGGVGAVWKTLSSQMNRPNGMVRFMKDRNMAEHGSQEAFQKIFQQAYTSINQMS